MTRSQSAAMGPNARMSAAIAARNQALSTQSYHVELSSTLYGGDLRTPDTPSLMTQSMDPSILAQLAGGTSQPPPPTAAQLMSRSLGPEQLSHSLGADHLSYSLGELEDPQMSRQQTPPLSIHQDPMTQSLGPEQLARSLGHPTSESEVSHEVLHLTNGETDSWVESHPARPTTLFGDQAELGADDSEGIITNIFHNFFGI